MQLRRQDEATSLGPGEESLIRLVPEPLSRCLIINASGGRALALILVQGRVTEIKAADPSHKMTASDPSSTQELVLSQPVYRRTHDKSLKGRWKRHNLF